MEKKEALRRWQELTPDQPILPHFTPIASDARGSTYGACGIRISGNPEFIDAVLSRLKDLIAAEAGSTRLTLNRAKVKPTTVNDQTKQWKNADTDAETCYIQIRERTAKTRQRKVRENSDPLPFLGASQEVPQNRSELNTEGDAEKGNGKSTAASKEVSEAKIEEEEPRKYVHIGSTSDGEVLWDW